MNKKENRFILIERYKETEKQTVSRFHVCESDGTIVESFCSLELPWRDNQRSISCIPVGSYEGKKRTSPKFKNHIHILDVSNRDWILVHTGNRYSDSRGCVILGMDFKFLDGDSFIDVINSVVAMRKVLSLLPDEFYIKIVNNWE